MLEKAIRLCEVDIARCGPITANGEGRGDTRRVN